MKELIILGGSNGSGKTTFAKKYLSINNYLFLNADEIELESGSKHPTPMAAGREFLKRLDNVMEKDQIVLLESTLSGKYLIEKIRRLKSEGTKITVLYIYLDSAQETIDRIRFRVLKGGHNIPEETILRRYKRSFSNFWNEYKNIADNWIVFNNGGIIPTRVVFGEKLEFKVDNFELFNNFINKI